MATLYVNLRGVTLPPIDGIIVREFRRSIAETIMTSIEPACDGIKVDYVAESLRRSALTLVLNDIEGVSTANITQGAARFAKDSPLIIDVICSAQKGKGNGSRMLSLWMDIAHALGFTGVQAKPIKSAIPFYTKNGFEARREFMVKNICL